MGSLGLPRGHWNSREFTGAGLGVFGFLWVPSRALSGDLVHSGSRKSFLGFGGFIGFHVGSVVLAEWSQGSYGLAWVHSCALGVVRIIRIRMGSLRRSIGVVGYIRFGINLVGLP